MQLEWSRLVGSSNLLSTCQTLDSSAVHDRPDFPTPVDLRGVQSMEKELFIPHIVFFAAQPSLHLQDKMATSTYMRT